jgi:hypothetical protein
MPLHTSWTALFNSLTTENKSGNQNIAGFITTMDFEVNSNRKMTQLNQPFNVIPVANNTKGITVLYNPHIFGGTLLRPTNKVGCLVGTGPVSIPSLSTTEQRYSPSRKSSPPLRTSMLASPLTTCPLSPPRTMLQASSTSKLLGVSFLLPFLPNAILAKDSLPPLP